MQYKFNNLIHSLPSCSWMTQSHLDSLWGHILMINAAMATIAKEQTIKAKWPQKLKPAVDEDVKAEVEGEARGSQEEPIAKKSVLTIELIDRPHIKWPSARALWSL